MVVLGDGQREPAVSHGSVAKQCVPSIVFQPRFSPPGAGADDVDLLPRALADIADPQVAGRGIEPDPPRIAQAAQPDLGQGTGDAGDTGCRPARHTALARVASGPLTSMRRILPRSVSSRWPLPSGSPPEPPSPIPM